MFPFLALRLSTAKRQLPSRLFPRPISLRLLMMLVVVGQLVGIVGLLGYLSLRNGQRTVNSLASQLRQELTARIEQELQGYFATPHEINRLNGAALARGELDIVNATAGEAQLYQQMKISPNIAFVYCGSSRNGEFLGVLRSPDDGSLQLSYGNRSNDFFRDYYTLDVNGNRTFHLQRAEKRYDSRQRPWYQAALSAQKPVWTDIYIAFTTGLPNITASLPVYDRSGKQLLGVCATDVVLPEEFRTFLRSLKIGVHGQAFVVDRQGTLISNSNDEPLMVGQGDEARSVMALESQDPLVRSTARYLVDTFGGFDGIDMAQQLAFDLRGQRQFLEVLPFQDDFGLDWLIIVVVPESDFMAQVYAHTRMTIVLSGVALLGAIALAILTSRWITRPIRSVSRAAEKIAQGQLDQQVAPTAITEINTLAHSFNTMTEQVRTSFAALRQSETQTQALIAAMPDLLIRMKTDGTYQEVASNSKLSISNLQTLASADFTIYDTLPPELADLRLHHVRAALETGQMQVYEQSLQINGRRYYEEVRIVVVGEDEVLTIIRDITESREAAAEILKEKLFSDTIIDSLPGVFYLFNNQRRLVRWNKRYAQVLGYTPEEMAGIHVLETIYGPDRATIDQRIGQAFAAGEALAETRLVTKDGDPIPYLVTGRRLLLGGETYLLGAGIDLTERQRAEEALRIAEEKYRSIYENALEGIFQASLDGRFISVNPAMAKIYGYDSPEQMVANIQDINTQVYVDEEDRESFNRQMDQCGQVKDFEYRVYCQDGSIIWVEENTRAVRDDKGALLYFEGIIQDITERKQKEADLRRQLEELQIEIDHQKREQDVALITQSGYFQELQEEMARVNLDEFWS